MQELALEGELDWTVIGLPPDEHVYMKCVGVGVPCPYGLTASRLPRFHEGYRASFPRAATC